MKIKRALALLLTLCMVLGVAGPGLRLEAKAAGNLARVGDTEYADLAAAVSAAAAGDTIYLLGDAEFSATVTITKKLTITAESPVTMTKTSTYAWLTVNSGGDVTLEGPITVAGTNKYGALIEINKGTVTMNDGVTLKDNETGKGTTGGAVNIKDGTFIMNGGTISNCKTTNTSAPGTSNGGGIGGAVRVSLSSTSTVNASFTMNGGTITGCSAYAGGAVGVENVKNSKGCTASFVMNGGTISGCSETTGKSGGAAVWVHNLFYTSKKSIEGATFTMNGGKIINNTGKKYGTINMYIGGMGTNITAAGHIYILGGEISGNFVGSGSNNSPSSFYGNGIYLKQLYNNGALLTVGGDAKIDDEVFIANASGNYFEVLDDFTGYVKIFSQTGGNAGTHGTLVAKAVSATGVASTATQAIAGRIIPIYPYLTNQSSGERYEHPNCGVVVGTNSGEYVLGEKAPAVVEYTVTYTDGVDGEEIFADQTYTVEEGTATPAFEGTPTRTGYTFKGWEPDVAETVTADVTYVAQWEQNRPAQPSVPMDNGGNVTPNLITIICDCDENHAPITYGWGDPAANSVFPTGSEPVWNEELGAWTIGVRIDSIQTYYVGLRFDKTYGGIKHVVPEEMKRIDTTLVWNAARYGWNTLTGEPYEIHVTCQAKPEAPQMGYHLSKFQIEMVGEVNGVEQTWNEYLHADSVTVGNVMGNRADGFTVDVTVTLDDSYLAVWLARFAPQAKAGDYILDPNAPKTLTFTLKYIGDTTGELYDGPEYWAAAGNRVQTVSVVCTIPDPAGDIVRAYLNPSKGSGRIYVDLLNVTYNESVELKLYSGEKLLTTASLNTEEYPARTFAELTGSICVVAGESDTWPNTPWLAFDNVIPDKIELVVDGRVMEVFTNIQASRNGGAMTAEDWAAFPNTIAVPALPANNGGNVTPNLITIVCDCDESHAPITYGWGDPAANIIFPNGSEPVWNEELGAWTIGVRIDSIQTYYVGLRFNKSYNGIQHEVVMGEPLTSDEYKRIDTTLVWNPASASWNTLTGEPFEIHVTCQTKPEAPQMGFHLGKFQIKLVGNINGEEKVWHEFLHAETVTMGEVKGNRVDGFTVDITVTLADDDSYYAAWVAKHAPVGTYIYDWSKTEQTVTFTLKYIGDTSGELYDEPTYWAAAGSTVYTAYLTMQAPEAPEKFGSNVTPNFVEVICDSDPIHHPSVVYKWMQQSVKVVQGAVPVWNAEVGAWTIDVKVDSISMYYVLLSFDKAYGVNHDLVGENYFIGTLKWDSAQQLWVPLDGEPFEIHVTCKSVPDAPSLMGSYQIQVKGDRDHNGVYGENGELFTTTIPADGCSFSEIYGSRDEGFFIDVTVTLEDGDIYITNWIAQRAPGEAYVYHWDKTQKTVTFTLKYSGDLNGNLQGDNDWVLATTGESFGIVAEAFVIPAAPEAPKQPNVTQQLVAIICDSDGERHQTVYGKWYPLGHCTTTSDIVWNDELNTYVVDIRIGSLYIMYVDQLEDANNDTMHELAEDITSINSRLKWDYEQNLWVTLDGQPIELHTTCRTVPKAPEYKHIDGYQIKVWGDVDGTETAYTISLPEGSYTLSEVRGSREEGFFVDVTITLADGDAFVTSWIEKKVDPGITYVYDTERTEMTITFTLRYNGDLDGTLYGDRHAANTNYDWIIGFNHNNYPLTIGVIAEAYVVHHHVPGEPATCTEPQLCMECGVELHPSLEDALAQAIADLEKAIAAGDEANADALADAVEKLEKAIADMEAAIADNGASIVDLEAAVTQLQEAVDALKEAYKAADAALKAELEAAIAQAQEALQATIDKLAERVAQNETNITALQEALAKAMKDLNDAIAAGDEANAEALAKAVEAMEKALADAVAALEKADADNKAALEALIAEAKATLEEAIAKLRADLEDAVENLENADKENAEALAKAIKDLTDAIKAAEDSAAAEDASIRAELASAKASLQAAIAQVQKNLDNAEAALKRAIAAGDAALAQKIDDLNAALSAAIAASNAADEALKAELTAAIAAGDATLQAAIDTVAQNLAKAEQELTAAIAAGDKNLDDKIAALNAALEAAIAASEAADVTLANELEKAVETLNAAIAQVQKNLDNAEAALKEKDAQHDAELDRLNTFVTVVCVIASLALVGCATLLVITIIGKRKKV